MAPMRPSKVSVPCSGDAGDGDDASGRSPLQGVPRHTEKGKGSLDGLKASGWGCHIKGKG